MIINGSLGNTPPAQPVLLIWSDASKKKINQALRKIDADAFNSISKIVRVDAGTAKARHIVHAKANSVATVQAMQVLLMAAGLRTELYDPGAAAGSPWTLVTCKNKSKKANAAQGLSSAMAKAGITTSARPMRPLHPPTGQLSPGSSMSVHMLQRARVSLGVRAPPCYPGGQLRYRSDARSNSRVPPHRHWHRTQCQNWL